MGFHTGQHSILQSEINADSPNTPLGLLAVRLLCDFTVDFNSNASGRKEGHFEKLAALQAAPGASSSKVLAVVAASMWLYEDNTKEALKCVFDSPYLEQ